MEVTEVVGQVQNEAGGRRCLERPPAIWTRPLVPNNTLPFHPPMTRAKVWKVGTIESSGTRDAMTGGLDHEAMLPLAEKGRTT
jgi:hypothetical protein